MLGKELVQDGHLLVQVPEKKWHSMEEKLKADVQFSVQQHHFPGVSSKTKDAEKLSIHFCCGSKNNWDCFSHNCFCQSAKSLREQSQTCVKKCESLHDRSGQLDKVMGHCSQWNHGRSSFGELHPITPESSIATMWRTQIAFTRKQSE